MKKIFFLFVVALLAAPFCSTAQQGNLYAHPWDVKWMKCHGSKASFDSVISYLGVPDPDNIAVWTDSTHWYIWFCDQDHPIAVYNTLLGVIEPHNTPILGYTSMAQVYADYYQYAYQAYSPLSAVATLDFPSTSGQSNSTLIISITGAVLGDVVGLGVPDGSIMSNSNYTAWVSSANTVTVSFNNYDSGSKNPSSGTFKVSILK